MRSAISLTSDATKELLRLLDQRPEHGVRIRLRTRGCSGLSYVLEYVDRPNVEEENIAINDRYFLYVHTKALLFLVGTEMDYQETPTRRGFVFRNPHEKGQCGCGASFHV
jgi:iron-sulfur cluster assembly protein